MPNHTPQHQANDGEIIEDQVYSDARYEDDNESTLTVKLCDRETVVLEDQNGGRRFEDRKQFEEEIGTRWTLEHTPDSDNNENKSTVEIIRNAIQLKRDSYTLDEDIDDLETKKQTLDEITEDLDITSPEREIQLEQVSGIGGQTAENIREKGFERKIHFACASTDQLTNIDGLGDKTVERLMEKAGLTTD